MTVKSKLAGARRREERVEVCLRGDLQARYTQLEAELAAAKEKSTDSLAGGGTAEIAQRLAALAGQMREWTVEFVIVAVSPNRWTELLAKHPPRKDNVRDQMSGFNPDTMSLAALKEGVVEPELDDEDWMKLLDDALNRGQLVELCNAALRANETSVDVPFSSAPSSSLPNTGGG